MVNTARTTQRLSEREHEILRDARRLFDLFREKNRAYKDEVYLARRVAEMRDPEQLDIPQLPTLRSTVVNCVADQMDNIATAVILPERPDMQEKAEQLTDLVQHVQEVNDFSQVSRERFEDFFVAGTGAVSYLWDENADHGKGNIAILAVPIESLEWDYMVTDIQQGRAVFKKSWHPRSYFEQHYPDKEKYIIGNEYSRLEVDGRADAPNTGDEDDEILLLEYWYRRFDAKTRKYSIHVAHIAGGAMLYCSEKEMPKGAYLHGEYPFVLDVHTRRANKPYGMGTVIEMLPMQRYVNRYSMYVDENARINTKQRMLYTDQSGINTDDLQDLNKQLVLGDNISENHIRWFPELKLPSSVQNQMFSFIDMMKQDSGQSQFNRGEFGGGITAKGAIEALQEAGGKTSRSRTDVLKDGFRKGVQQILWLIKQFYKKDRIVRIVGANGAYREIDLNGAFDKDDLMPYAVRIQIQRQNPMRVQAENNLIMQLFNAAAQQNQALDVELMIRLLQVDGKDRFLAAIREVKDQQEQNARAHLEVALQENQALSQQLAMTRDMLAQQAAALDEHPMQEDMSLQPQAI